MSETKQTLFDYKKKLGNCVETIMEEDNTLQPKSSNILSTPKKEIADLEKKKKKVVKDIIKKKTGTPDNYNPDPELSEKDTIVKT